MKRPETHPSPDCRRSSLDQVAERLSALASSQTGALAAELHTASLCCREAHTRWEDLLQSLQNYRLERTQLEAWLDHEIGQMQQEALGLVVPSSPEDLNRLRPDTEGRYAWDRWESQARAAGLSEDLAGLGRAVMREAVQHAWEPEFQAECGWSDAGQQMLAWAQREPERAAARWQHLLETDGERGRWTPDGDWQPL